MSPLSDTDAATSKFAEPFAIATGSAATIPNVPLLVLNFAPSDAELLTNELEDFIIALLSTFNEVTPTFAAPKYVTPFVSYSAL